MLIYKTNITFPNKDQLLKEAKELDWVSHVSHNSGTEQPYQFVCNYNGSLPMTEAYQEVWDGMFTEPAAIYVMRMAPRSQMHIHKDTYTKKGEYRHTVMLSLLTPSSYETRIEYYTEDKELCTSYTYDDYAILTNTSKYHRGFNDTDEWRYSLQVTFKESIYVLANQLWDRQRLS